LRPLATSSTFGQSGANRLYKRSVRSPGREARAIYMRSRTEIGGGRLIAAKQAAPTPSFDFSTITGTAKPHTKPRNDTKPAGGLSPDQSPARARLGQDDETWEDRCLEQGLRPARQAGWIVRFWRRSTPGQGPGAWRPKTAGTAQAQGADGHECRRERGALSVYGFEKFGGLFSSP